MTGSRGIESPGLISPGWHPAPAGPSSRAPTVWREPPGVRRRPTSIRTTTFLIAVHREFPQGSPPGPNHSWPVPRPRDPEKVLNEFCSYLLLILPRCDERTMVRVPQCLLPSGLACVVRLPDCGWFED